MKINFIRKLRRLGIKVVNKEKDRDYYYADNGIVVEIGGMKRLYDPSIFQFETEVLAQHYFNKLFKIRKINMALKLLNNELKMFKWRNPRGAKECLQKISVNAHDDLLRCIGVGIVTTFRRKPQSAVMEMYETCGKNYPLAVHENVACFLLGIERCTKCHTCKLAKYDEDTGWLKCKMFKHIPENKIGGLPSMCVGEFNWYAEPKDGKMNMYSNLCLFDVDKCRYYRHRSIPRTMMIEALW